MEESEGVGAAPSLPPLADVGPDRVARAAKGVRRSTSCQQRGMQIVDDFAATTWRGEQLLHLDLHSLLRLTRAILPEMIARKPATIVDIASLAARPTPGCLLTTPPRPPRRRLESLRGELPARRARGHRYPGPVETPMAAPLRRARADRGPRPRPPHARGARAAHPSRRRARKRAYLPVIYTIVRHLPGLTRWSLDRFSPKVVAGQTQPQASCHREVAGLASAARKGRKNSRISYAAARLLHRAEVPARGISVHLRTLKKRCAHSRGGRVDLPRQANRPAPPPSPPRPSLLDDPSSGRADIRRATAVSRPDA